MSDLCKNAGSTIIPCNALSQITTDRIAGFKFETFRNFHTNKCRVATVVEKSRNNKLEISFCPACGANIETHYPDKAREGN